MSIQDITPVGRKLLSNFTIVGMDILHENYECTIELPELNESYKQHFEDMGFEITHQEGDIYHLKYEYTA
jgi:hypothetical protein